MAIPLLYNTPCESGHPRSRDNSAWGTMNIFSKSNTLDSEWNTMVLLTLLHKIKKLISGLPTDVSAENTSLLEKKEPILENCRSKLDVYTCASHAQLVLSSLSAAFLVRQHHWPTRQNPERDCQSCRDDAAVVYRVK